MQRLKKLHYPNNSTVIGQAVCKILFCRRPLLSGCAVQQLFGKVCCQLFAAADVLAADEDLRSRSFAGNRAY
ncbi:Uncharacterised protein [Neisseria animalis]|nr:Uncharacterised protein [Neisseria animalis]